MFTKFILYISLTFIVLNNCDGFATDFNIGDVFKSAKDVSTGVITQASKSIPSADAILDLGKQTIAGYPFEVLSDGVSTLCRAALAAKSLQSRVTPEIGKLNFQLRTRKGNYSYPLKDSTELWKNPEFDPKKKVVIFATGWTTNINSTGAETLEKPYICRNDVNYIVVDAANFVQTLYTWSALNTEEIGRYIALGLKLLINKVPVENIHLIGHSLGAHIMGAAGRYFTEFTDKIIPRITGLDPAKPCFKEGEELSGLLRGDADFIDIIHTNPGVFGIREPIGDVDFYPGGLDPLPKGTLLVTDAHTLAIELYAETVYPNNEHNFMGKRCTSLSRLRNNKCRGGTVPMGYDVPHNVKGNYFLEINNKAPYGKEANAEAFEESLKCTASKKNY